jgi:uncharacterized lipoprotein YddW (UPF0748 family)
MVLTKIYTFNTLEEANQAVEQINTALGIPTSEESTTRTHTTSQQRDGLIYISHDETIESVLGSGYIEHEFPILNPFA